MPTFEVTINDNQMMINNDDSEMRVDDDDLTHRICVKIFLRKARHRKLRKSHQNGKRDNHKEIARDDET